MSGARAGLALALGLAVACGEAPTRFELTLGEAYDLAGVGRVYPDGLSFSGFRAFFGAFEGLSAAGGRVNGALFQRGSSARVEVSGTLDGESGQLVFEALQGTITGTQSEDIDGLGGRVEDVLPRDGVADQISGYLHARQGTLELDAVMLGVLRAEGRPRALPSEAVRILYQGSGVLEARGDAGAAEPRAGVEIYAFRRSARAPDFVLGQAALDGSFQVRLEGAPEDVYLLRMNIAGRAGDARFFTSRAP